MDLDWDSHLTAVANFTTETLQKFAGTSSPEQWRSPKPCQARINKRIKTRAYLLLQTKSVAAAFSFYYPRVFFSQAANFLRAQRISPYKNECFEGVFILIFTKFWGWPTIIFLKKLEPTSYNFHWADLQKEILIHRSWADIKDFMEPTFGLFGKCFFWE